jgi:hypothetical protein
MIKGHYFFGESEADIQRKLDSHADLLAACRLLVSSHTQGTDAWPAIIAAQAAISKCEVQP